MERFAIIIPDRGDRPELLEHCLYQMGRQTVKPECKYLINYLPHSSTVPDLVARVRRGIDLAREDRIDIVYIIENDDYYPDDYFEKNFIGDYDFVGIPFTHYYHIMTGGHWYDEHPESSSLFCTGFRLSVLSDEFHWSMVQGVMLDSYLWKYAAEQCRCSLLQNPALPIGIKHALGYCPGAGHNVNMYSEIDKNFAWLRSRIRPESFDFYMDLKKRYGS